jgi:DNA-binding PadR family transcriptional regulator
MLSESSMSGSDLAEEIKRITEGDWRPSPGSIYLMLKELLNKGLITELTKREGSIRRYIISSKGKVELEKLEQNAEEDVTRQLRLLAVYSSLAGNHNLEKRVRSLVGAALSP